MYNVQIICHSLQTAVAASDTGYAFAVVLRQDQFHCGTSVSAHLRTVGVNNHALLYHIIAGSDQLIFSFDLYHTDTTGCDLIDPFQITQLQESESHSVWQLP